MSLFRFCPQPPGWTLDWEGMDAAFAWVRALKGCPQDPIWHAEGDVWIHTRMVLDALIAADAWRSLDNTGRVGLFAAAALHDVAKPACTRMEQGRFRSRGHAVKGAILARRILWEMDVPFAAREAICGLVRHHQLPYYPVEDRRVVLHASQTARLDRLCELARADVRGRVSADLASMLRNIDLFEEHAGKENCLTGPRGFHSDHGRFQYFVGTGRDPDFRFHNEPVFEATLLCGPRASDRHRWLARGADGSPVVSLDEKEQAREHLRAKRPIVLHAPDCNREARARWIKLFAEYDARVRIVYVESSREPGMEPPSENWDVPDRTEAHSVEYDVTAAAAPLLQS